MELGYFTMPLHPPGSDVTKTMDDDIEQFVILDGLRCAGAWVGEHRKARWPGNFNDYCFKQLPWTQRLGQFKLNVDMPDSDVTIDYLMDNIWIVGSRRRGSQITSRQRRR